MKTFYSVTTTFDNRGRVTAISHHALRRLKCPKTHIQAEYAKMYMLTGSRVLTMRSCSLRRQEPHNWLLEKRFFMALQANFLKHGLVVTADTLEEIREFMEKLNEEFPDNRFRFSTYDERNGKCIATYYAY